MAGFVARQGLILCILFASVVLVKNSKLNVPRVLLPVFKTFSLKFILEGTDSGCYKWSTSRPEIIQLTPYQDDSFGECSSKASVSAITKDLERHTAIVFAEDIRTGRILRCDVITDVINSLDIVTTTRELYIEEAPEAFEVRAYDAQGNEFTSLEGVEFKWTLSSWNNKGNDVKGTNFIRFMTFNESPYETPPTVHDLDARGMRGHIILLEGLKTGTAKVTVQIPYAEYCDVKAVVVSLSVMSNLIISPVDAYIMPGDSIQYRVMQVKNGRLEEVKLLSNQYFWEIEQKSVAIMNEETNVASGIAVGKTKVILHDRNVDESDRVLKIPTANMIVAEPAYLTLNIAPYNNWAVLVGEKYEITVDIYDTNDHKLNIGDVEVHTVIPTEYFSIDFLSANNTYVFGQPVAVGTAQVRSTLSTVKDFKGKVKTLSPKISTQANLMIYKTIVVEPLHVIVPWEPILKPRYEIELLASGGDGSYTWSSSNRSVARVAQTGVVTTFVEGCTEIYASMNSNPHNRGISQFHVLPPRALEITDYVRECEIGKELFLHVALFTVKSSINKKSDSEDLVPFTQCNQVPFGVRVWDDLFVYNSSLKTTSTGVACASIGLQAIALGTSKVTVTYEVSSGLLTDHVTIASYNPLTALFPSTGELVLAVGCSANIIFTGGPMPWPGQSSEHAKEIDSGGKFSVLTVSEVNNLKEEKQGLYTYKVLCKEIGEADVILTVSNKPSVKQSQYSKSTASVRIFCAKPRYLSFHPVLDLSVKASCHINLSPERVVAQSYKTMNMSVSVKDAFGREFYNFSSLQFDWSLSDEKLASVVQPESLNVAVNHSNLPSSVKFYQVLQPRGRTGILEIRATIVGYHSHILRSLDIVPEYPPFGVLDEKGYEITPDISSVCSVILVNDARISPNTSLVFNHPNNKLVMNIHEGSGYYELIINTEEVADVSHQIGSKVIEIIPKVEGVLKLTVIDMCLPSDPAFAEVQVVSIGSIQVEAPERVEKGRCASGVVRIYDSMEQLLPIPRPDLLDLRHHIEEDIVSVSLNFEKDSSGKPSGPGEVHFVLTGLVLGEKYLTFSAGQVRSEPVPIQVFPPLRLMPSNITLIVGAIFQVSSKGGPLPDANVEFSLSSDVANVDKKGLVEGVAIGHSHLIGRAVGIHRLTGQRIVYSEDSIDIHVVPLAGIKILTPITRIINGAIMPIWAVGIPDQITPLILGSSELPIKYSWHVSNKEVATVCNVLHHVGVTVSETDLVIMHFHALKPGRVSVSLDTVVPGRMTHHGSDSSVEFSATLEIEVFEELRLIQPPTAGEIQSPMIRMTPNSDMVLKTNHKKNVQFTLLDRFSQEIHNVSGSDLSQALTDNNPLITLDPDGRVKSHSSHGEGVVQVLVKEDFGLKQKLNVMIEVKPVRYMLTSVQLNFKVKEGEFVSGLPRGTDIPLVISFHDNAGRTFDAFDCDIKMRMNRFDLMKVGRSENKSIIMASVINPGATMIKLWDDLSFQRIASFFRLNATDGIFPGVNRIVLGDIVCFSVPFEPSEETAHGIWTDNNPLIFSLNTGLGIGRARAVGTVVIRYQFSSTVYASKEIKVLPISKVKIVPLKEYHISNSDPESVFRVPFALRSKSDVSKMTNLLSKDGTCPAGYTVSAYPFVCSLQFTSRADFDADDVFIVNQEFSFQTGQYSCDISASEDPPPILSTLDTNLTLTIECGDLPPTTLQLRFYPAIYVSTPEIHLSDAQMSGTLIVSGIRDVLRQLKVTPGSSLIQITKSEERVVESAYVYNVILSDKYWTIGELSTSMNISVISEITKQSIQVPLKIHLVGEKGQLRTPCLLSHVSSWSGLISDAVSAYQQTIILIIAVVLIVISTIYGLSIFTPLRGDGGYMGTSAFSRGQTMFPSSTNYSFGGSTANPYEGETIFGDSRRFSLSHPENMRIPSFSLGPDKRASMAPFNRRLSSFRM